MYEEPPMDDDQIDDEEVDESSVLRELRKQVKEQARSEKEALARAEAAERSLAFRDSGLDLANPQHKFFADHYDGEMTADAVAKQASELGFLAPPAPAVPDAEITAHAEIANVTSGAETASSVDPAEAAYAEAAALGKAGTPRKVAEIYAKHLGDDYVQMG